MSTMEVLTLVLVLVAMLALVATIVAGIIVYVGKLARVEGGIESVKKDVQDIKENHLPHIYKLLKRLLPVDAEGD